MGMDGVFVHLGKNYFMKGFAKEWFTDKQLEKLSERVIALDPLLIGKKAPNIVVKDTAQKKFLELYAVEADFTVVYIWSPTCGHCKTSTPKLKTLYDKVKDKGVEVFAVGSEYENEEWKEFIIKHELNFLNGSDGETMQSNFRNSYDVFSTPQTYLLDKDKNILSKKMSIESLEQILEYYIEEKENENKLAIIAPAILLCIGIGIAYEMIKNDRVLPIYSPAMINPELVDKSKQDVTKGHRIGDFVLTNQDGEELTNKDFDGYYYVADFSSPPALPYVRA